MNDEYFSQFFPDRKVLSTTSNNFSRSSLYFPCLIAAEHYVSYCSGGKTNFRSNLNEERSENPSKFHKNLFRGCIESMKSKKHAQGFFLFHVDLRNMPIYRKIHKRPAYNVALSFKKTSLPPSSPPCAGARGWWLRAVSHFRVLWMVSACVGECCSVMQCVVVCCSVLQCVAVCCFIHIYTHICTYI